MSSPAAIHVDNLTHRYGARVAVRGLSFGVGEQDIFALLGPNGSGKTTLFRVLSTLIPLQEGTVSILGHDLVCDTDRIRQNVGVVFQAPSIDKKLTVAENLRYHGRLYGLSGRELRSRSTEMLSRLGLSERAHDLVEKLSGGLRRRVELAEAMLHRPRLLLLDEPSTGLDPGARHDLWEYLRQVRRDDGVTVMLTTHLLEEAEYADRLAIMHEGRLVALDTPTALQASVGGDAITIQTAQPAELATLIGSRFACQATVVDGTVRLEQTDGHRWVPRLVEAFPEQIDAVTLGKPTLKDVFIDRTGHQFLGSDE